MDPDPGSPKTYGSYGSGSETLLTGQSLIKIKEATYPCLLLSLLVVPVRIPAVLAEAAASTSRPNGEAVPSFNF